MLVQMELFDDRTELELVIEKQKELAESVNKIRKGLYSRHGELAKCWLNVHERLEVIERNICKGSYK